MSNLGSSSAQNTSVDRGGRERYRAPAQDERDVTEFKLAKSTSCREEEESRGGEKGKKKEERRFLISRSTL